MSEQVTQDEVKAVLKKNGIHSLDDLTKMIARNEASPEGTISKHAGTDKLLNWLILFWKFPTITEKRSLSDLPDELGGELLKKRK